MANAEKGACCNLTVPVPKPADVWAEKGRTWTGPLPAFPTKKARLAFFRAALTAHPAWAYRALVLIFRRQTAEEQAAGATILLNGVGFSGVDAEILTSFATQYLAKQARYPGSKVWLSPKQEALLRRKMPRYAAQLIALLEAEGTLPSLTKPVPAVA
jgi:hypothetical protein